MSVRWAVETDGVVLINEATGVATTLGYPQAAIWDFLTRGEPVEQICAKMCVIASLEPEAARALVAETLATLQEWRG